MDELEKFLDELRNALIGSEIRLVSHMPPELELWVKPTPAEADRIVAVVRDMFGRYGDWQIKEHVS